MKDKIIQQLELENWNATHNCKINIYLTQKQKQILRIIGKTHNISMSTAIDIISTQYYMADYTRQLMCIDTCMYKSYKQPKTSIKIRNMYALKTREINNAVVIFCEKLDKDPNNPIFFEKMRNKLNHEFQDAIDPWVHYHEFCHMKQRYERENNK